MDHRYVPPKEGLRGRISDRDCQVSLLSWYGTWSITAVVYIPGLGQSVPKQYTHWGLYFLMRRSHIEDSGVLMSVCDACWKDHHSRVAHFAQVARFAQKR